MMTASLANGQRVHGKKQRGGNNNIYFLLQLFLAHNNFPYFSSLFFVAAANKKVGQNENSLSKHTIIFLRCSCSKG